MGDARVIRIAFVMTGDRFPGMGEEDRVTVAAAQLKGLNREVLFGDGVRNSGLFRADPGHRSPAEASALERAAGFPLFLAVRPSGMIVSGSRLDRAASSVIPGSR